MTTPVANEVSKRLALKAYADPTIAPGTPLVPATLPGVTGGQILRRVSAVMNPQINEFVSAELNTAQQIPAVRHGALGVTGTIGGELSPGTYELPMSAVLRCTPATVAVKASPGDFSSLAATASSSKFTLGSSDWATLGFRVGDTFRPGTCTNQGNNFTIVSISTVDAVVYPAPVDQAADTTATITVPGKKLTMPDPPVKSKYLIEHYYSDIDVTELAVESRFGQMKVSMDNKIATIEFTYMGRQYSVFDAGASSPFFTGPAAITTSPPVTSYGGAFIVNGVVAAIISKADFMVNLAESKEDIAFTQYSPEIFTGKATVTGSFDALFIDNTYKNLAQNETEISLLLWLSTAATPTADFVTFFFPAVKLGAFTSTGSGEAGVTVTYPFSAYQKAAATGYDANTTMTVVDSLAT